MTIDHEQPTYWGRGVTLRTPARRADRGRWDLLVWFTRTERIMSRDDLAWAIDEWRREAREVPVQVRNGSTWRPRPVEERAA